VFVIQKPKLKDESRLLMHNIVIKGTKQWETINSFRTDNGETVFEDASTKEDAIAKRTCLREKCYHQCCSIKRLVE
jgi:hypothetical protein